MKHEPEEIPDAEHELVIERVCAIDVAKASGKVCMRLPQPGGRGGSAGCGTWRPPPARSPSWPSTWSSEGIEKVTVESTSDYWRIWFYLLEAAGLDVQLVNARDVKNVPGRPKTDKLDAVWLAKLTEKGLLRPSFVPPAPRSGELRDYTRLRVDLTRERTRLLAAAGEAARRRADQGVGGGLDLDAVGAGHARGADRRGTRPATVWPTWPAAG